MKRTLPACSQRSHFFAARSRQPTALAPVSVKSRLPASSRASPKGLSSRAELWPPPLIQLANRGQGRWFDAQIGGARDTAEVNHAGIGGRRRPGGSGRVRRWSGNGLRTGSLSRAEGEYDCQAGPQRGAGSEDGGAEDACQKSRFNCT